MEFVHFREKDIIDPESEVHYHFITQVKDLTEAHDHDFYEIFLSVYGNMTHYVNGSSLRLEDGSLVFMRPHDVHYYKIDNDFGCGLINLAFPVRTFNALIDYLGRGFSPERLLKAELPPMVVLSNTERETAKNRLESFNVLPRDDKQRIRTESRILLLEFFAKYFSPDRENKAKAVPLWLSALKLEMEKRENFTAGIPAVLELSGKSQEHLCRAFREFFRQTPSQFVNELRLNYAANLLVNSDETVVDICMESGFESLSHFYHQFKRKFNMSPVHFRNIYHRSAISGK